MSMHHAKDRAGIKHIAPHWPHANVIANKIQTQKIIQIHSLKQLIFVEKLTAMAKKLVRFDWVM